MSKIILTGDQFKDWEDKGSCFGSKQDDTCYDPTDAQCKSCGDKVLCEKLFKATPDTKIVDASVTDVVEVFEKEPEETAEKSVEKIEELENTSEKHTRQTLTEAIVKMGTDNNVEFTVTTMVTRDKIFIGDTQAFTVTDKTIRIYGVDNGECLGLTSNDYEEKTKAILVNLEKTGAINSILLNYFKMDDTVEEEPFKEELDFGEGATEGATEGTKQEDIREKGFVGNPEHVSKINEVEPDRKIVGGISVTVFTDDTVEISTVITKERFDLEKIMNKMKELLESF